MSLAVLPVLVIYLFGKIFFLELLWKIRSEFVNLIV